MQHILGCDFWCSNLHTASSVRFNCMPYVQYPYAFSNLLWRLWFAGKFCFTLCRPLHGVNQLCIILTLGFCLHMLEIVFSGYSIFNVLVPEWIACDCQRLEFEWEVPKRDCNWLSPVGDVPYFEHRTVRHDAQCERVKLGKPNGALGFCMKETVVLTALGTQF
jgi:hypothetical protein